MKKIIFLFLITLLTTTCKDKLIVPDVPPPPVERNVGDKVEGGTVVYVDVTKQHGLVAAPEDISSNNASGRITNGTPLTATVSQDYSGSAYLTSMNYLYLKITHPNVGDLSIYLVAPNGYSMALSKKNGGSGDNYDIAFSMYGSYPSPKSGVAPFSSGYFSPEEPFSKLNLTASSFSGVWALVIIDDVPGNDGTLVSWSASFTSSPTVTGGVSMSWDPDPGLIWSPSPANYFYFYRYSSTGPENTSSISNYYGNTVAYAASVCEQLVLNGYSDWYLPTVNDLYYLRQNKSALNIQPFEYWSSCDDSRFYAYSVDMSLSFDDWLAMNKSSKKKVRPVRKF
ncbi:proprotein convertase P-domain-containing protein [Aurantibacillus circumpalustris]|uniref:proprotein convertase P-domain-containing protein n=1 Tax=Aurantibacillus circumpalustris TaxID=3036359 RepID=UPI00295BF2E6|nr:proprotein convertase P-domain-containing protein [Aurantibacillus circumpalustris]